MPPSVSMEGGVVPGGPAPADLSRSKPCARPFLISNIMGLEEEGREEGGSPPQEEDQEGGVSPGGSPGPDSDLEMSGADEDSIAKVTIDQSMLKINQSINP